MTPNGHASTASARIQARASYVPNVIKIDMSDRPHLVLSKLDLRQLVLHKHEVVLTDGYVHVAKKKIPRHRQDVLGECVPISIKICILHYFQSPGRYDLQCMSPLSYELLLRRSSNV